MADDGMDNRKKIFRLKRQAKALALPIDFGPDPQSKVERASDLAYCDVCELTFFYHTWDDELYAVVTCRGELLHL